MSQNTPILEGTVKAATPTLITPDQLNTITDTLSPDRCKVMAGLLNELGGKYGITDKLPFQMFLANLLQESNEMNHLEEDMSYKTADRIRAVWPTRFKTVADAQPYVRNPQALANKVYNGRMGNTGPNDGWLYRGGGPIGITGKATYQQYADYIGKPIEETANLIRTDDKQALDSACWFFAVLKKLMPVALTGNFPAVCSLINTGSTKKPAIGMDVRQKYYDRITKVLG